MRRQTNTINWGRDLPLAQGIEFNISPENTRPDNTKPNNPTLEDTGSDNINLANIGGEKQ